MTPDEVKAIGETLLKDYDAIVDALQDAAFRTKLADYIAAVEAIINVEQQIVNSNPVQNAVHAAQDEFHHIADQINAFKDKFFKK